MAEWTDKKIEKLKSLWDKGVPTAEMGKLLGVSKNAIVGKVHRLGLSNRVSPIGKSVKSSLKSVAVVSAKKNTSVIEGVENLVSKNKQKEVKNFKGVSLLELQADKCTWPIGEADDGSFLFCGKDVFKNKSYCLEHCVEAYSANSFASTKSGKG